MTLVLSALEGTGADRHRVTKSLSSQELTHASLEIWTVNGKPQTRDISSDLFEAYLPGAIANRRPWAVNLKLVGDLWMVISWYDSAVNQPLMEGTEFIHRSSTQDHFRYFQVPNGCEVDPKTGKITVEHQGQILTFTAEMSSWPDQMLDPGKYVAVGILETLLTPDDANPLTMLACAGHQPCKGAAKQIISKLTKIQDLLNK